jgi:hypothetical protein
LAWSPARRLAFRFCFAYFGLYCLATQISGGLLLTPSLSFPGLGPLWPMRQVTFWVAANVFRVNAPLEYTGNSGDSVFYWVQTAWLLTGAVLAAGFWTEFDRQRPHYATLEKWFRLGIRLALADQMLYYGMVKIIPTQFPVPSLITLVEPAGNLALTGLLWTSIGASMPYQIFTGCTELLGGLLLLLPRTMVLGALISMAALIQIFVLNLTYDIGLKQFAFHLLLLAVLLLIPELRRLGAFFLTDRPVPASTEPPLFRAPRANRAAVAAQIVFGLYLVGMFGYVSLSRWYAEGGGGSPKSPLYGIWDVEQLVVDGLARSPVMNDYDRRWRRVIFDSLDDMAFQRTDDSFAHYGVFVEVEPRRLTLRKSHSASWQANFTFERPSQDRLVLDGHMDEHKVHVELKLVDLDSLRLLNSGFRWIRPPDPFAG